MSQGLVGKLIPKKGKQQQQNKDKKDQKDKQSTKEKYQKIFKDASQAQYPQWLNEMKNKKSFSSKVFVTVYDTVFYLTGFFLGVTSVIIGVLNDDVKKKFQQYVQDLYGILFIAGIALVTLAISALDSIWKKNQNVTAKTRKWQNFTSDLLKLILYVAVIYFLFGFVQQNADEIIIIIAYVFIFVSAALYILKGVFFWIHFTIGSGYDNLQQWQKKINIQDDQDQDQDKHDDMNDEVDHEAQNEEEKKEGENQGENGDKKEVENQKKEGQVVEDKKEAEVDDKKEEKSIQRKFLIEQQKLQKKVKKMEKQLDKIKFDNQTRFNKFKQDVLKILQQNGITINKQKKEK